MYRITLLLMVLVLVCSISTIAAPPDMAIRHRHADRNKDGVVDRKEMYMQKKWEQKYRANVNTWWERRADTNGDGKVDANELSAWRKLERERIDLNNDGVIDAKERRLCWRHARSRVNTPLERKYDKNHDGWLEPDEVRELLQDKYKLIKTHGKAGVDTLTEAEYDINGDGLIDSREAGALREDLK